MSAAPRQVRVGRVLGGVALLGIVGGVGLSLLKDRRDEEKLAEIRRAKPPGVPNLPAAPRPLQAPKPDPEALAGLPPYPNAQPMPVMSQPTGVGGEMKLAWFTTDDTPDQVLNFYEHWLDREGKAVVSHHFKGKEGSGYAGYFEGADPDGKLHMIAVMRQSGQTLVFPSVSSPTLMVERRGEDLSGLPSPPRTRRSVSFPLDESGSKAWYSTAKDSTVGEVLQFYKETLPGLGWTIDEASESGATGRVGATRKRQSASVSLTQKPGREVTISITIVGQA